MDSSFPKTINIVHYHLHKGGVTSVILQTVQALLASKSFKDIKKINIYVGSKKNIASIQDSINSERVAILYRPYLGYIEWCAKSSKYSDGNKANTALLQKNLDDFFTRKNSKQVQWWAHNHHIGKNPVLTAAILRFIQNKNPRIILQMHDFPEQARYPALASLLKHVSGEALYKGNSKTRLVVINEHDRKLLQNSGLNATLLSNIVKVKKPKKQITKSNVKKFREYILDAQNLPLKNTNFLVFTYPVRCIRRKNVMEAMLLTKLFEALFKVPCVFNITLPGESEEEKPYSERIRQLIHTGKVKGIFSAGTNKSCPYSFEEMCLYSDAIISSSVQEGFGFSYLETALMNRPLLARSIAQAKELEAILDLHWPSVWYQEVLVPRKTLGQLPNTMSQDALLASYQKAIKKLSSLLPKKLYNHIYESLEDSIATKLSKNNIDFSYLSIDTQEYILENFEKFANELIRSNGRLLLKFYAILQLFKVSKETLRRTVPQNPIAVSEVKMNSENLQSLRKICLDIIAKRFSEPAFLKTVKAIFADKEDSSYLQNSKHVFASILLSHATIENLRLLFTPLKK